MSSLLIEPEHVTAISGFRPRPENYALAFDRYLAVSRDRGYPFTLIDNHAACLDLDGTLIAISPAPATGLRHPRQRSSIRIGQHEFRGRHAPHSGEEDAHLGCRQLRPSLAR